MLRIVCTLFVATAVNAQTLEAGNGKQWYKGNTHAHTLWSDGDAAPEVVVDWYVQHGYDFLCLSDHNVFADRELWFPVKEDSRLTMARVEEIQAQFGDDWVELKVSGTRTRMRLKTLSDLKARFEKPGTFLLIPAEEITSPEVHINALNIRKVIPAAQLDEGETQQDLLRKNFEAIEAQEKELGIPILAHINHPNWSDGISVQDVIAVGGERFFEVYNGHSYVRNWGDEGRHMVPTDRYWDIILAMRMKDGADYPMYGVATDDSHEYFEWGIGHVNSGRGWIHVLADSLSPNDIITAMKSGALYASTGVTLSKVSMTNASYAVSIDAEPGVTYTTEFIGTMKNFDATSKPVLDAAGEPIPWASRIYSEDIGQVIHTTTSNPAVYEFTGEELYVRARVISDTLQENPYAEGDKESAWTQPKRLN